MTALDTNIIIHLLVKSQKEHPRVRKWFAENQDSLATTSTNIAEVLRLLTHPRIFPAPLALSPSIDLVDSFLEQFQVDVLHEDEAEGWWTNLKTLLASNPSLRGNEVFDARIALCLKYNGIGKICTLDADFSKYPFLEIVPI